MDRAHPRPPSRALSQAFFGCVAVASLVTTGCGLNTAVLQKGGNGRMGVLLNCSCDARPCDPIDPGKPTIVITHGWNPLPNRIRTTFGPAAARAICCRCGDRYNVLSWDWNAVRVSPFNDGPLRTGKEQGRKLACALRSRGVDPCRTQLIAHSLGTVVVAQAAQCLTVDGGRVAQLTLLDPPEDFHEEIFCKLGALRTSCVVENYWAPGVSGFGAHAPYTGVRNYCVRGESPWLGLIDLSMNNHVFVMRWYYDTIRCRGLRHGFQDSVIAGDCDSPVSISGPHYEVASREAIEASAGSRKR
jgi:pimeloyl-ACP methyl ester carboxylesterase